MTTFENSQWLWGLVIAPFMVLAFLLLIITRKKRMKRLGDHPVLKEMIPDYSLSKQILKFSLFALSLTFLILGIANLQTGGKLKEVKREGADILICLDISNSMLAQDLKPNRLERAKLAIEQVIDRLKGDRLGLIVFAGEAYTQLPITMDYACAKTFLRAISTDMAPVQGTSISEALQLAFSSFGKDEGRNKAVIVITDGEDHEENTLTIAAEALQKNITIHTIGIGSREGVPIPAYRGGIMSGYRKDKEGNTVVTKLNENLLEQLADAGHGIYVRANNVDLGLNPILARINAMDKKVIDSKQFEEQDSQFQWFIALSLIFLVSEFLLDEKVSAWWKKLNLPAQ